MELREACYHLRHRRGMYLPDDRYASVVSFVTGLASASDGRMLAEFNEWVGVRVRGGRTPVVWWSVIYDSIPSDSPSRDAEAVDRLLELLESFAYREVVAE